MINHLLDLFPLANFIWERGEEMFKKKRSIRGRPDLLIEQWLRDPFKNSILNRI